MKTEGGCVTVTGDGGEGAALSAVVTGGTGSVVDDGERGHGVDGPGATQGKAQRSRGGAGRWGGGSGPAQGRGHGLSGMSVRLSIVGLWGGDGTVAPIRIDSINCEHCYIMRKKNASPIHPPARVNAFRVLLPAALPGAKRLKSLTNRFCFLRIRPYRA